jgi:hypothetical protein
LTRAGLVPLAAIRFRSRRTSRCAKHSKSAEPPGAHKSDGKRKRSEPRRRRPSDSVRKRRKLPS